MNFLLMVPSLGHHSLFFRPSSRFRNLSFCLDFKQNFTITWIIFQPQHPETLPDCYLSQLVNRCTVVFRQMKFQWFEHRGPAASKRHWTWPGNYSPWQQQLRPAPLAAQRSGSWRWLKWSQFLVPLGRISLWFKVGWFLCLTKFTGDLQCTFYISSLCLGLFWSHCLSNEKMVTMPCCGNYECCRDDTTCLWKA